MPKYEVAYDNDVGPNDEGFWEWWSVVEDGRVIAKCDREEDARRIVASLEAADRTPRAALKQD